MAQKRARLKYAWYIVLDSWADLLSSPSAMQEAADMPIKYAGMMLENLYEFMMSTFPGEESPNAENFRTLWNCFLCCA